MSAGLLPPRHLLLADVRTELEDLLVAAQAALPHDMAQVRACVFRTHDLLSARNGASHGSPAAPNAGGQLMEWQLQRVLAMIESRLSERFVVPELAHAVRLGSSQFTRAFRTSIGWTPYAYIIQRRVELAKRLMFTTRRALSSIALDCGFADQAHLSRVFRRQVGQGPSSWRRSHMAYSSYDCSDHLTTED